MPVKNSSMLVTDMVKIWKEKKIVRVEILSKNIGPETAEKISEETNKILSSFPPGKRLLLVDTGNALYLPASSRKIFLEGIKYIKLNRNALVFRNKFSRILTSIFIRGNDENHEIKVFSSTAKAIDWLNG